MKTRDAIDEAKRTGNCAIRLDGENQVVDRAAAECLNGDGREFAYLCRTRDGQIVTIPVN